MTRHIRLAAAALLVVAAGCQGLADQLDAEDFAVGTLVRTPDLKNPKTGDTIPGATAFQLFFGKIDKSKITDGQTATAGAFTGIAGAQVVLAIHDQANGDHDINVPDTGNGEYFIDSDTAQLLTYDAGATYTVTIHDSGQDFSLHVVAPPATDVAEFAAAPDRTIDDHAAGSPLTITRSNALGASGNPIAFVNVSRVSEPAKADAWNNVPKDPLGLLELVLNDSAFRADSFTIPGSTFDASSDYVVTFTALAQGTADASSGETALFVGSTLLAGVATGGAVTTP